ncbi:Chromosome transmission fidelity protein 18 [Trichoderma lentiforme]|uniref:Chromosome transmission fidelity protein 18 n=1 Tax=Trichoderma lentiforme TaxID=1567552 RepID=A0A9P5CCU9_9HYPO|nr:Chromosome transmission fidelity protein 18 [Trichoderma lentiforme]
MLSASSPITFPSDPPSPPPKRAKPHDIQYPTQKPRVTGPFVDSDSESDAENRPRASSRSPSKRRKVEAQHEQRQQINVLGARDANGDGSNRVLPVELPEGDHITINTTLTGDTRNTAAETGPRWSQPNSLLTAPIFGSRSKTTYKLKTCGGSEVTIRERKEVFAQSYESMVAARSKTKEGRAKRDYYGVDIHNLINAATSELAEKQQNPPSPNTNQAIRSMEATSISEKKPKKTMLWTEKYRARNFMDLCGDDSTNRLVLRWLKKWDPLVFPGTAKARPKVQRRNGPNFQAEEEKPHRKILMLTGPPGLGKTTLAHVCAKQAGYEVIEVNASDDRSRDVVKNRIRTSLGTESVKNVSNQKALNGPQKVAKPACVVVDEVDGVVTGSGASGEGGFIKALIDLVLIDQKNSSGVNKSYDGKKKKGDDFRLMRPLILICNDVYHPSLRPLRQSNLAEIIHVGRPTLDTVVGRLKTVFEKEGIPCDKDAARKLCESAWGMASGIDARRGQESTVQGDLRGVMVVGEWVASRFKVSSLSDNRRLTRDWIERNILQDLANGSAGARGLGRGSVKDIISRLFQEGGGFPKQALNLAKSKTHHEQPKTELGFGEHQKKYAMECLRQMVDSSGEISHIVTEIFAEYPNREFNDDSYLSKPNQAYDWLYFHDACQSKLYASQEWELAPYLAQPVLACHHLFASPIRHYANGMGSNLNQRSGAPGEEEAGPTIPFSGPRADYQAFEAEKQTRAQLQALQAQLSPTMMRLFRSAEDVAAEFMPYLARMLSPDVKPVVVGGSQGTTASVRKESERAMVKRASEVLAEVGIALHKGKIESDVVSSRGPQFVYRMEPDIDSLATYETASLLTSQPPTRFAVRQVLDQELRRTLALRETHARQARFQAGRTTGEGDLQQPLIQSTQSQKDDSAVVEDGLVVKKDFFGRIIQAQPLAEVTGGLAEKKAAGQEKVWVTFHEGLNNAVRKPMTLREFLSGL